MPIAAGAEAISIFARPPGPRDSDRRARTAVRRGLRGVARLPAEDPPKPNAMHPSRRMVREHLPRTLSHAGSVPPAPFGKAQSLS